MKKDWMIKESELDDDQIRVLTATLDKSCIVSGCAGSGKSVLALIKAQRIQKEKGANYQIIVYTKALCNYMNSGRQALGLSKNFEYHYRWKNKLDCPSSDYVIVDEIQDFTEEEIMDFLTATKKNFFFFGDTAQSIYEGLKATIPVEEITDLVPSTSHIKVKPFELYRNYRLPIPVAKVVQYVGVGLDTFVESTYKSKENELPRFIQYDSKSEQLEAIHDIIQSRNQTDVGILLPHNNTVKFVADKLTELGGNYEMKYSDKMDWTNSQENLDFDSTNPKVMTYHSAKGLQFETVYLPYIENFSGEEKDRKALYVAMTRTYRNLYVMYCGELPYPLSQISRELYKTTETDEVDDI